MPAPPDYLFPRPTSCNNIIDSIVHDSTSLSSPVKHIRPGMEQDATFDNYGLAMPLPRRIMSYNSDIKQRSQSLLQKKASQIVRHLDVSTPGTIEPVLTNPTDYALIMKKNKESGRPSPLERCSLAPLDEGIPWLNESSPITPYDQDAVNELHEIFNMSFTTQPNPDLSGSLGPAGRRISIPPLFSIY